MRNILADTYEKKGEMLFLIGETKIIDSEYHRIPLLLVRDNGKIVYIFSEWDPRLSCPGRESNPGLHGGHSRKKPLEKLVICYSEHLHMSARPVEEDAKNNKKPVVVDDIFFHPRQCACWASAWCGGRRWRCGCTAAWRRLWRARGRQLCLLAPPHKVKHNK